MNSWRKRHAAGLELAVALGTVAFWSFLIGWRVFGR
jgi:hypothetical protein